ncbi:MAG: hypothetical protein MPW15_21960 [Candidatus Manganitrophus sp.]|nr:hypothetical protein [Candidatus Manganitrophus sp.]
MRSPVWRDRAATSLPRNNPFGFFSGAKIAALFLNGRSRSGLLDEAFVLDDAMDTFLYAGGIDLTGYEDGTENPKETRCDRSGDHSDG